MKRGYLILICIGVVSLLGAAGVSVFDHLVKTNPSVARKVDAPLPVQVASVKETRLTEVIGASGAVQPIALVNLTAAMSARIERVAVDQGDWVSPGQVLVWFDRELLHAVRTTAEAEVRRASAERGRAIERLRRTEAIYRDGLSNAILDAAQAALEQANGELRRADEQFRRIKAVYDQGVLSRLDLEKAEADVDRARADQSRAAEHLLQTKKDLQVELEKAGALHEEARVRYKEAEERLLKADKDLQGATVVSPVSGYVMERSINPGETPRVGQKFFTIGQTDQVLVETRVAEERVGDIQLKQGAVATFNAFPNEEIEGKVVKIKPVTDPKTRTFLVYVQIPNLDRKLIPGLTGFIRVKKEHRVLAVPSVSLISPTGVRESTLFAVGEDGIARLKKVKIGVVGEGLTQIVDGLSEGERVVAVGQLSLRDGDLVRIGDEFDDLKPKFAGGVAEGDETGADPISETKPR
ncbi:MAG: efflux RND transporter periplasmic adaptor subunit [Candidatus Manganitrophaceae bacterium]